jgi:hypothetical protein
MIILSVGMPRAGSGWYYNLTNDLMLASGAQDARQIRQRYHLQNVLTEVNCNIGALTPRRMMAVSLPSMLGNTFVIKAHAAPSPFALRLIRIGQVRAEYIYRDPRDALLSAMENGQRSLQRGRANAFSDLTDIQAGIRFMLEYLQIWQAWINCSQALHARYEDLLIDYDTQAEQLAIHLGLSPQATAIQQVIAKYRPEKAQPDQKGLHFSQGKIGRFRQKMTAEQQELMAQAFSPYLEQMGYPP